ncbi:MAG TPA: glycerate kinase [Bryobacteraceae bacterium]|nr:glycerate kinase [Bryobacteraceae bacterium]
MSVSVKETKSRRGALAIFRAALEAADPVRAVLRHVRVNGRTLIAGVSSNAARYRLADFDRVWIVGAGKAAVPMARALEDLLADRIVGGSISVPYGSVSNLRRVHVHEAAHPVPDRHSVAAGREIARLARECGPRDLLLCVISGGASALMAMPAAGVTLAMKKRVTRLLQARGATIHEMNAVRKHLSAIKAGHLARLAYPATVLALILSDVIGDNLDAIGSGPTVPDPTTCAGALGVLRRYRIPRLPFTETPKPGNSAFRRVRNLIVGSNRQSIEAARATAESLGYRTIVLSTTIDGETRDIARMHAAIAREMISHQTINQSRRRVCFLSGGETTVTLRGKGLGGRNQEFVLAAFEALEGTPGVTIFSAGTDGRDGPTDAAGAIAESSARIPSDTRQFLDENDSYRFFEREGGLIKTGPTGTNVMDVRMMLIN